jgi:hypothetical protein
VHPVPDGQLLPAEPLPLPEAPTQLDILRIAWHATHDLSCPLGIAGCGMGSTARLEQARIWSYPRESDVERNQL